MKTLILVRHANALPAYEAGVTTDAARPLSEEGRQKATLTARALAEQNLHPQVIYTSPLVRAVQTAEILAQTLGAPLSQETVLNGMYDESSVRDFLAEQLQGHDTILAVGHNPNISYLTHLLCGQTYHFSPGSFAVVNMQDENHPQILSFGE